MKMKIRVEKTRLGYRGRVVCEMHDGRTLWSDTTGTHRPTRESARQDAQWLLEQHKAANRAMAAAE